ncbi:unnamed protein product [Aureobasidium pullulans]|nr:unnamed protein product [Aureobasidium pullulans]
MKLQPLSSQTTYDKKKYHVPFPGAADDLAIGIEDGFLTVSTAEIAEIFRPIVNGVIDLVERQRIILAANHKTPKGVILVGGFGQSNYLFRCLKQRFADEAPPPTYTQAANNLVPESEGPRFMVLQPENPWTAVVSGAVMSGLEKDVVVSRKARRYYGVVVSRKWDAATHSLENKHWSTIRSEWRARNQISWCIEKGQSVPVDQPVLFGFSHQWDFDNGYPATVEPRIIVSNAASAPSEFKETVETRTLCRLLTKLKDVPRKHFKTRTKNGKKNRRLDYSIGVLVNSGSLEFDLRVDGVIYGKVRADYE